MRFTYLSGSGQAKLSFILDVTTVKYVYSVQPAHRGYGMMSKRRYDRSYLRDKL